MRVVAVAVLGLVLGAGGVNAQETIRATLPTLALHANPKAEELRKRAEALYMTPRSYRRAGALHEQEARIRSVSDPLQAEALDHAARLFAYVGEVTRARDLMERAARSALKRGDVTRAAHALLDAAFISLGQRDVQHAFELAKQAELLSHSPLLPVAARISIVRRIDPARVQFGLKGH